MGPVVPPGAAELSHGSTELWWSLSRTGGTGGSLTAGEPLARAALGSGSDHLLQLFPRLSELLRLLFPLIFYK